MNVGQRVMLIGQMMEVDCIPPPIGAVGEITEPLDEDGDYFVLFEEYPCPWGEPDWFVPPCFLIPLDDGEPVVPVADMLTV